MYLFMCLSLILENRKLNGYFLILNNGYLQPYIYNYKNLKYYFILFFDRYEYVIILTLRDLYSKLTMSIYINF